MLVEKLYEEAIGKLVKRYDFKCLKLYSDYFENKTKVYITFKIYIVFNIPFILYTCVNFITQMKLKKKNPRVVYNLG